MSQSRTASLGRNPSADQVKRRKSWQAYDSSQKQTPDVRSILGKDAAQRAKLRGDVKQKCTALPWPEILSAILTTLAVLATAALILVVLAIVFHSSVAYTRWVEVRDGTAYYVQEINHVQTILLVGTFGATVLIVLAAYALLMYITKRMEARKAEKQSAGLDDIAERDLEQGDAQLKTKQNISKLMSDAEKQYVAEYIRKSAPAGVLRKQQPAAVPSTGVQDGITVQKLDSGQQEATGYLPPRSWSLKRMLTIGRSEADRAQPDALGIHSRNSSFDWNKPPSSEVAAQLSSPDAFNRASSSHAAVVGEDASRRLEAAKQDSDAMRPSTPRLGELSRQKRDAFEGGSTPDEAVGNPRIMVTKPIEAHEGGSADSDSEEEEFDRERQHSILSHPATEPPFSAQILTRFPQQGLEGSEPSTSAGWMDVGLGSDDEDSIRAKLATGHMYASSPVGLFEQRQAEVKPAERLTMLPLSAHTGPESQIRCYLSLELEEVLPRPQAGLLNRLLRLARVDRVKLPGGGEEAFVIQPGKEYMMGLKLRLPGGTGQRPWHAKWVRIQLPDGQPVRFNVEESSNKPSEWVGSACWDTCLHSSEVLSWPSKAEKAEHGISISITVGLEDPAASLSKAEAYGVMHIIPQAWLRSKSIEESSPPAKAHPVASFCLL